MKQTFFLLLCWFITIGTLHAQSYLMVELKNGTKQSHILVSVQHATFVNNQLVLQNIDGSESNYALSAIRKLAFSNEASTSNSPTEKANTSVVVYPNPAHQVVFVHTGSEMLQKVEIFRIDGQRILQTALYSGEQIDVSGLATGLYVLRVNNQAVKLYKR